MILRAFAFRCLGACTALGGIFMIMGGCATTASDDEAQSDDALVGRPGLAFQTATVPVCWEDTSNFAAERALVRKSVANTWEAVDGASLKFVGWRKCGPSSAGVRIRIADERVHVTKFGRQLLGEPGGLTLNFTFQYWAPNCARSPEIRTNCIEIDAIHEFGHVLGFSHEQNRSDIPATSGCSWDQLAQGGSMVDVTSAEYSTFNTMWDPDSVMNYCNPTYWWRSNNATFDATHFWTLSSGDVDGMRAMYPAKGSPRHVATCKSGDGLFCGGNGVTGDLNTLYQCTGNQASVVSTCANGCMRMPQGVPDSCQ